MGRKPVTVRRKEISLGAEPWRLEEGDCVTGMVRLPAASVDAVVTDPPYGIRMMGLAWDGKDIEDQTSKRSKIPTRQDGRTANAFGRASSAGTYNRDLGASKAFEKWTRSWAKAAFRALKPGGHVVAFGGPRTFHRLTAGIEDAGFDVRDHLMWLFGMGYPKSHNLDGEHAGLGTALKPAWEPIVLARKPLDGTVASNVARHGTGALNIDGCRIPATDGVPVFIRKGGDHVNVYGDGLSGSERTGAIDVETGRWPANLVLDEVAAEMLDRQTGPLQSGSEPRTGFVRHAPGAKHSAIYGGGRGLWSKEQSSGRLYGDAGGPSRFFYCAKADRLERDAGLHGLNVAAAPDAHNLSSNACARCGLRIKHNGSGKGCECGDLRETVKLDAPLNSHATVKPLDLMRWLVRLVTPKSGGVVLDPFTGSGTTGIAALLEGRRFVGFEKESSYVKIAGARIAWWEKHGEAALERGEKRLDQRVAAKGTTRLDAFTRNGGG